MIGIDTENKEKKVDGEHSCPEIENTNYEGASEKEVVINRETFMETAGAIYQLFSTMNIQLDQQDKKVSKVLKAKEDFSATLEKCFNTVADCQTQTADFANQALERHALYPAILTVDLLTTTICQLAQQANTLNNSQQLYPQIMLLAKSVLSAAEIAKSKKASLDIQSIQPAEMDELDKDMHKIVNAVNTDDESKHKKIHQTLSAGLIYRGKILREAKVSVYRFNDKVVE